jgi:hypothetical protein
LGIKEILKNKTHSTEIYDFNESPYLNLYPSKWTYETHVKGNISCASTKYWVETKSIIRVNDIFHIIILSTTVLSHFRQQWKMVQVYNKPCYKKHRETMKYHWQISKGKLMTITLNKNAIYPDQIYWQIFYSHGFPHC